MVDRPVEDVWAHVSTVENMEDWVAGVSDVRRDDGEELGVGSTFSSAYTYRGETFDVDDEVTAYEPPHRLDVRSTAGPFPFAGSIRLVDVDGAMEVSNTIDAGTDGLAISVVFTVLGPLVRRMMRRGLAGGLDELATALEGDGEHGGTAASAGS